MSDLSNKPTQFVDGVDMCVAMIERDAGGMLLLQACNDAFFRMIGVTGQAGRTFPQPFDTSARSDASRALRDAIASCFSSTDRDVPALSHLFLDTGRRWQLSLQPISQTNSAPGGRAVLVSGFAVESLPSAPSVASMSEPQDNTSRYRALVDLAYDAIVTMDERHFITLFNRAAENLFGYKAEEVLGLPIVTLLPEQYRADHPRKVRQFAENYQPTVRQATPPKMDDTNSVYGRRRDGTTIPVEISVSKIELNGAIEFMAVVRDISDRARLMALLKKQAGTDVLTGLPNRREFQRFVEEVLASEEDLSVFILDIDFFKIINDNHGHDAGDEVLRVLAQVGAETIQGSHLFARWGGEEFVAAMRGTDAALAVNIAETLRRRFERQDFSETWRVAPIPFTVSIGVVGREAGETNVQALMKRADQALYRAKQSGRNRVEAG